VAKQVDSEQILDGARRALALHGPHGTTLEDIAEQAGVSRVTLYRRGTTRESIIAELASRAEEEYRRALWPALTGRGLAVDRLELALDALCDVAEENLALLEAIDQGPLVNEPAPVDGTEVPTRATFTEPLERLINDGVADGSVREGEPLELAETLFNMVATSYMHLRWTHRWAPERARTAVVGVALNGVRSDRSK
jgi:AcrR family transcriptional regulator